MIERPGIEWKVLPNRPAVETLVRELEEAIVRTKAKPAGRRDLGDLQALLSRPDHLRSLVISRGKKNRHLDLLENGFDIFLEERSGPGSDILKTDADGRYLVSGEAVVETAHQGRLPEQILSELVAAAYHKRDGARFFRWLTIIIENEHALANKAVPLQARHALASWKEQHRTRPGRGARHQQGCSLRDGCVGE